ncbi:hydrolase 2, exosortase A system-associated [Govanella unica]|uniref:Hydrolase 2, exosortase A system-associated n=1 Tax=Govanella unica TaxID=2975056 RepID=A0A9X3Z715_9PROT|nr:hydrolase 2, exosortase A system-associated [Govania unica]MDA5193593.1 hydrolase 2, exosortase A system-associated [Govania unica]
MGKAVHPFYLEGQAGPLFANLFAPPGDAQGSFLFVPPFAEELNRSRHVMAALGRALQQAGYGLMLLDLYGTGDSGGEFGDGSPTLWRDDLSRARQYLEQHHGPFLGFVALRSGALLAADLVHSAPTPHLLLWSPISNGEQFLTQFLRIRVAEGLGRNEAARETTKDLKARLDAGETLEIGGYNLTPAVADWLATTKLAGLMPPQGTSVTILDAQTDGLSPATERLQAAWNAVAHAVPAPQFWSLLEPEPAPTLIRATIDALRQPETVR